MAPLSTKFCFDNDTCEANLHCFDNESRNSFKCRDQYEVKTTSKDHF